MESHEGDALERPLTEHHEAEALAEGLDEIVREIVTRLGIGMRTVVTDGCGSFAITNMSLVIEAPRKGRWPVSS